MEEEKDKFLWKLAKKRVAFRRHLFTYLLINLVVWLVWFFTKDQNYTYMGLPWPAWMSFGWGIGLAFNYYDAYYSTQDYAVEREYQKLTRNKNL
ncbi:2TM domain-containing protein [Rufibacter roseolus]|uniref:2TM domain-containing protein n=1 Tax=Rufibacter roseolus TaxID=2817375 RepID=UPI001B30CA3C|nr:2TM domain-containing protein [Rufibacter roseolus]